MNAPNELKPLHLTLKRRWFDEIRAGTKTQEYRERSPHWRRVLGPHVGRALPWGEIHFRNGYEASSPWMRVALTALTEGPDPWQPGETLYILHLGPVLEVWMTGKPKGERLKSEELKSGTLEPFNSSTLQPFNPSTV